MPTGFAKNLIYKLALPFLAPSPRGKMRFVSEGRTLQHPSDLEHVLVKHHVLGASLLLKQGVQQSLVHVSVDGKVQHHADNQTLYRVASITKVATTLAIMRLYEDHALSLDAPVSDVLPRECASEAALNGVTIRQLLCHTSGLRDVPAYQHSLDQSGTLLDVLHAEGVRGSLPGKQFAYCNFGFGLLGCVIEQVTGQSVASAMQRLVFAPLGMRAVLDASTLSMEQIMPIRRVLQRGKAEEVRVTALGKKPLTTPDPLRHFGHTAGAMYTDCVSLQRMMSLFQQDGVLDGQQFLQPDTIRMMMTPHASYGVISPGMSYGLGLILFTLPDFPNVQIIGHQGFAYGCVDGAFITSNHQQVIFLNGGASELRDGRLGVVNRDVLRFALGKELPSWT